MRKRSFLYLMVIVAMCILLPGNGYPGEKHHPNLPTEYPPEWGVPFIPSPPLPANFQFGRLTQTFPKGFVFPSFTLPLPCDILWDRDVPMTMRDGKIIYINIFRPAANPTNLPAIIAWEHRGRVIPRAPSPGVPLNWVSGLQAHEGPDPAFWCNYGYAVVVVDLRGHYMSEGNAQYLGMVNAADGYDFVEWVAKQDWSSGKVAFQGNSWLAFNQWPIAALNPPHLTAIAPWNGMDDVYKNHTAFGCIPDLSPNGTGTMDAGILTTLPGLNYYEGFRTMLVEHPTYVPYWQDKAAVLEKIKVPAYVVADQTTTIHRMGAYEGFRRISSKEKWFRANNTTEWIDQWNPKYNQDLLKFFDHYMKGIDNGWEKTPRVRMAFLDASMHCTGDALDAACFAGLTGPTDGTTGDLVDVPFSELPLAETQYQNFYLDAAKGTLSTEPVKKGAKVSYDANTGKATFTITFNKDTYLAGYITLHLWVEAQGANDMDLVPLLEKLDAQGHVLQPDPYARWWYDPSPPGTQGRLRVSLRDLDHKLSTDFFPQMSCTGPYKYLHPGEIVQVDFPLQADGMVIHAGQQLRLTVAGGIIDVVASGASAFGTTISTNNSGYHIIHTGKWYDSYLTLPIIPAEAIMAAKHERGHDAAKHERGHDAAKHERGHDED